jgi:hypothetical protein
MTSENRRKSNEFLSSFENKCINTIRFLAVDAVQKANSGHPGMPMEASDLAYVLWTKIMKYNPKNPQWPNRDRFVLGFSTMEQSNPRTSRVWLCTWCGNYNGPIRPGLCYRRWHGHV